MPFAAAADAVRYVAVRNDDTVPCPPFGLMRVTGIEADDADPDAGGAGVVVVARPNLSGQTDLLVNGPQAIPADGGLGTAVAASWPALCACATDNDENAAPQTGEIWGVDVTRADGNYWVLRKNRPGFVVVGGAGDLFAYVMPQRYNLVEHVRVTGARNSDGFYPATIEEFDPVLKTWRDTGVAAWWRDANEG